MLPSPSRSAVRIGVDLGGTKFEARALGAGGRELAVRRVSTPREDYRATVGAIAALVETVEADAGVDSAGASVGVGIPGALDPATGLVKNANSTWLIGRPLDVDLTAALGRPVRIANDANCLALSEALDGAGAGAEVVFAVILGTGVGGGLVVRGRLVEGAHRIAGEWGHSPLPRSAEGATAPLACYCGGTECLEQYLSGPGLAADYARSGGGAADAAEIVARARAGDALAAGVLDRASRRLGAALGLVVNLIDPDVIVVGGGLSNVPELLAGAAAALPAHVFAAGGAPPSPPIRPAVHGDASGARGAAMLWD